MTRGLRYPPCLDTLLPDLMMLDATLRREWFHEKCPHLRVREEDLRVREEGHWVCGGREEDVHRELGLEGEHLGDIVRGEL